MDPVSAPLSDFVAGDSMPAELLAAFVEVMLESSRAPALRDEIDASHTPRY